MNITMFLLSFSIKIETSDDELEISQPDLPGGEIWHGLVRDQDQDPLLHQKINIKWLIFTYFTVDNLICQ